VVVNRLEPAGSPKQILSKRDVAGLATLQTLGALTLVFALIGLLFTRTDDWRLVFPWVLLLIGCIGLFFLQRWAAVLVCGLGWFGQVTFLWFGIRNDATGEILDFATVFWGITLVGTLLFTALTRMFGRLLRNGPSAWRR
jgi:hypothetical protein